MILVAAGLAMLGAGILWGAIEGPGSLTGPAIRDSDLKSAVAMALLAAVGFTTLAGVALLSILAPPAAAAVAAREHEPFAQTELREEARSR